MQRRDFVLVPRESTNLAGDDDVELAVADLATQVIVSRPNDPHCGTCPILENGSDTPTLLFRELVAILDLLGDQAIPQFLVVGNEHI